MPAPLNIDREAVKAHAITHGVREAARAFGLSEATVSAWSARHGWLVQAGAATVSQPLPKSMQPTASGASITPSQAAISTLKTLGEKTKSRLARGLARGALKVAHMRGETVLNRAGDIKAITDSAAKLHCWSDSAISGQTIRLELIAAAGELPCVDISTEVIAVECIEPE